MDESSNVGKKKLTLGHHTKLKLGVGNKVPPVQSSRVFSGRTVTTVEVRKKKGDFSAENKFLDSQIQMEDSSLSLLTFKEQMSRINALQNANVSNSSLVEEIENRDIDCGEGDIVLDNIEDQENTDKCSEEFVPGDSQDQLIKIEEVDQVISTEIQVESDDSSVTTDASSSESGKRKHKKAKKYIEEKNSDKRTVSTQHNNDNTGRVRSKFIVNSEGFIEEDDSVCSSKKRFYKKNREIKKVVKSRISRKVLIPDKITIQELSNRMSEKANDVLKVALELVEDNLTITTVIDAKLASNLVSLFNHTFKLVGFSEQEDLLYKDQEKDLDLQSRPPVVTVMGHVDHGKTSLLDALRDTNIVKGEFGGITQHIGAYEVIFNGNKITFIDTPGHEAFTSMRSRGANITDIVVLLIAADDGIMPQTVEAINHAKVSGVSIIVAINKIDKPGADVEKIVNNLLKYDIVPESLGGDVMIVPISAKNRINLDKLCESILLIAELLELKSPINCRASGVVVESRIERNYGVEATLIVQKGCLKVGDVVVVGNSSYGKIRCIFDSQNNKQMTSLPSSPVRVSGFNTVPVSGDNFLVVDSEKQARTLIDHRVQFSSITNVQNEKFNIKNIFVHHDKVKDLNIILKCDTMGSVEAICDSIIRFSAEEVKLNILHSSVGGVTDSDVLLAETSGAMILAFNVKIDSKVKEIAKRKGVDIRSYSIIYELFDDIKGIVTGMLVPIQKEILIGSMTVKQCFASSKQSGAVMGCYVSNGYAKRGSLIKLISNGSVIYEGRLKALRRFKDDVKEVKYGFECGILLDYSGLITPGDIIEVYDLVEEVRTIR